MYFKNPTNDSTKDCLDPIARLKHELEAADAVIVGAGAGLSASAGFAYDGDRFRQHFAPFEQAYGFHDMYSGGFYPYRSPEAYWAFWSRMILLNRYEAGIGEPYRLLLQLLQGRDYFVLTTNVDHQFQKAGFDKERLFYTQGDYGLFQCSKPCCQRTYDNEATVRRMAAQQENLQIPSELLPRCPVCGKPMTMNLRCDDRFVQDAGWDAAAERYQAFLNRTAQSRVVYLELGVGMNTPGIIKVPFWQFTAQNPRAVYVCVNQGEAFCPDSLQSRSLCISSDIGNTLKAIDLSEK